MKANLDCQHPQ